MGMLAVARSLLFFAIAALLNAGAMAVDAGPGVPANYGCRLTDVAVDGFYCALSDSSVRARLRLSTVQQAQWRELQAQHDELSPQDGQSMERAAKRGDAQAWGDYQRHRDAFIETLSRPQRVVLDAAVRAREQALADLQEKLILHNLML